MSPTLPQRPLRVQSDVRLLLLARRGDPAAFEALVRRYRRQLLGYCRRFGLGDAQAEDALQQGLLQAWRALRRGDDVHDVKSWMYRVVHNAALDALRRSGGDNVELDERVHGSVASCAAGELDRRLTVHATLTELAALPQMQREALVRTALHGDSHEQVASALGVSHAAVRGLVHRARIAMRAAAGALVPEKLLQLLLRWGLGAGAAGAPELGASGAGGGGMLAVLAKSGAVLATGGVLTTGLLAIQHGHARDGRSAARRGGRVSTRGPAPAGRATLFASIAAPNRESSARTGSHGLRRTLSDGRPPSGSHAGHAPTTARPRSGGVGGGASTQPAPVSVTPRRAPRPQGGSEGSATTPIPISSQHQESGQLAHRGAGGSQGGGVSGSGGEGSDAGRSSEGGQSSGGTQHGGGGQDGGSEGRSSGARIADTSGGNGSSDAEGTQPDSASGGSVSDGGQNDGSMQPAGSPQGGGPPGQASSRGSGSGTGSSEGTDGAEGASPPDS